MSPNLFEYKYLNNLRFADDIVLIAKKEQELKVMANELKKASYEVGLSMNLTCHQAHMRESPLFTYLKITYWCMFSCLISPLKSY